MPKFKIQSYNRDMTEMILENNCVLDRTETALVRAYDMSSYDRVVVLMVETISNRWRIIAKFY